MPPTSVAFRIPEPLVTAMEARALREGKLLSDLVEEAMSPERLAFSIPNVPLRCICRRRYCTCAEDRDRAQSTMKAAPRPGTVCALCCRTMLEGSGIGAPLGANDALVTVCGPCNDESPRSGRYAFGDNTDRHVGIAQGPGHRSVFARQ